MGDETWTLWAPRRLHLSCACCTNGLHLTSAPNATFTGVIRLAMVNNCTTGVSSHCARPTVPSHTHEQYAQALEDSSDVCISGGEVQVLELTMQLEVVFKWQTFDCWSSGPLLTDGPALGRLLMIALPHHVSLLCDKSVSKISGGGHRNVRGFGVPVVCRRGSRWVMAIHRQKIDWLGAPEEGKVGAIREALREDIQRQIRANVAAGEADPYNAGKLLGRLASLILVAEMLGEGAILAELLKETTRYLSVWLDQESINPLVYDSTWGGIVSCGCHYPWIWMNEHRCINRTTSATKCPGLQDSLYDFGNGMYNDHHFHYGYFIYAAAVVARFDDGWAERYGEKVLVLIRDIANPSVHDPYFTPYRHFDWFVGHSWALGITPDPLGRNQESTSEAANAWYGMYLFGDATGNADLRLLGEVLLLHELHSTNYYWHVIQRQHDIYPAEYRHSIVGIVREQVVQFRTHFSPEGFFVHGIQMLPITPVTRMMFHPWWVKDAVERFKWYCEIQPLCQASGFIVFLVAEEAMVDKEAAWKAALQLPSSAFELDCPGCNGNSRAGTLQFIAAWGNTPQQHWPEVSRACSPDRMCLRG
eukprot:NODE_106_length_3255_cov_4672.497505_g96_i0.p1 GENE.NODE_106_length_3255_cov_4672.497505_g96_i0~~NODE_106_length_3255_cov_4672.497505_g96_i0.p1  ORF type:complete len:588 (+),score=90.32 NODE_106_length_3255_cov_4672.497505_g96_i0:1063-2826(+)